MRGAQPTEVLFGCSPLDSGPRKRPKTVAGASRCQPAARRVWPVLLLGIAAPLLGVVPARAQFPREKYLHKNGKLRATLLLQDTQAGANGPQGVLWTVRPSGAWDRRQVVGRITRKPDRNGKLTVRQLQQLADVLAHAQVEQLPAKLGSYRGKKPHLVTLRWGKRQCHWTLPPGTPVPKYPDQPFGKLTREDCFAEVNQALAKLLQPPRKPAKNK
ncbi:MAG: hypothetical protein CMJ75_08610 [Planctomycetaceae bacterium]|nr:hypothetical protein [Planctomycetaceae bacterium]